MDFGELVGGFLIAVSLAMDAFAVSVCAAIASRDLGRFHIFRAAFFFGFFQFAMPLLGFWAAGSFAESLAAYGKIIAFGLLFFIGAKMAIEGARGGEESAADIKSLKTLFALSIATSIDAIAVGISVGVLGRQIAALSIVIGVITFAISLGGFYFGRKLGAKFERSAVIFGGIVLIAIGVKILVAE